MIEEVRKSSNRSSVERERRERRGGGKGKFFDGVLGKVTDGEEGMACDTSFEGEVSFCSKDELGESRLSLSVLKTNIHGASATKV